MEPISNISLSSVKKNYSYDIDKTRNPAETIEWIKKRFKECGRDILLKTIRIDTGRLNIPVFVSLCGKDATRLTGTKKQMGKGATRHQAEASALMELAERYSFFSYVKEKNKPRFKLSEIKQWAVDPKLLLLSIHDHNWDPEIVENFLLDIPLRWAPAHNLTKNTDQWIPFDWFYLINEYNGPASGNELEEAILQGICEVVERHVGTAISYGNLETPVIDPDSVSSSAASELIGKFRAQGIKVYLRDFSLDTGVPSVGVLAYDPKTFPEKSEIIFTVGTTPDPEKSLCRALTEVAQLAGDFENRTSYKPTYPKYSSLDEAQYLMSQSERVELSQLPNLSSENILKEIQNIVSTLKKNKNWEVFIINVTNESLQVPAIYAIIPGAHFLDRSSGTDFPQHLARVLLSYMSPGEASFYIKKIIQQFGDRYDLRFFLGYALEESGQINEALSIYEKALKEAQASEEKASILVHLASCYTKKSDYAEAVKLLEKAETLNPFLKELHHLKGVCFFNMKKHNESIAAFERVIELDPSSAIDYANIASNLRDMGHEAEAIILYEMALDLDPSLEFARENLVKLKSKLEAK